MESDETLSSHDDDFDLTQDPRKVFINFLIFNIKQIEMQIFFSPAPSAAVTSLRGLIGSLDTKSQKRLKEQYDRLLEYSRSGRFTREDIERTYNEVNAYLHSTYLKEGGLARPIRPSKDRMRVPQ